MMTHGGHDLPTGAGGWLSQPVISAGAILTHIILNAQLTLTISYCSTTQAPWARDCVGLGGVGLRCLFFVLWVVKSHLTT